MKKVRIAAFFPGKNPDFSFLDLIEVEEVAGTNLWAGTAGGKEQ
jgi:hypothetical protein